MIVKIQRPISTNEPVPLGGRYAGRFTYYPTDKLEIIVHAAALESARDAE
jgi:hypothetical protein